MSITYREVFSVRPFRVVFASRSIAILSDTLRSVALSMLVFNLTGSTALAAWTYGISFMPQLLGSSLFGVVPDRVRPRPLIAGGYLLECATAALIALVAMPAGASLAIVAGVACLTPVMSGSTNRVVADVLSGDAYVVGRSMSTIASSVAQLLGLAAGGSAIAVLGPRHALLIAAAGHLLAAVVVRLRLPDLPIRVAAGTGNAVRASWSGNLQLLAMPVLRRLLFAQWIPAALITGVEALIIPYSRIRGFPTATAGWLLAAVPLGMILSNLVAGRLLAPARRERLVSPLIMAAGLPLVVFAANPLPIVAGVLLFLTGCANAYGLGVQRRFREAVPADRVGQAFGLFSTGLMTTQGVWPVVGGLSAEALPIGVVIALTGLALLLTGLWVRAGWAATEAVPQPAPAVVAG